MSKLIKNWGYLFFSDIFVQGISFVIMIILAQKLSPEGFGKFNVVLSLVSLFTVFSNSGMNMVLTREVTLYPKATNALFFTILPIRIFSFFLSTISMMVYVYFKHFDHQFVYLFAILLVLSNSLWDIAESISFGHLITKYTTFFNLIFSSLWLLSVLIMPKDLFSVEWVIIIYSIIFFIKGFAFLWLVIMKHIRINREAVTITRKAFFIMCLSYIWMRIIGALADQVPILFLSERAGNAEVGYFSVGTKLIIPLTVSINTGLRAIFPFLTKWYQEDFNLFREKISEGFTFIMILGSILAVFFVSTSDLWIEQLFGNDYHNSVPVFNVMIWFGVLFCFDLLLSTCLSSTYQQNTLAIITTIDVIVIFPIYYWGTQYGAIGFAYAKLLGTMVTVIYHIIVFNKVLRLKLKWQVLFLNLIFFATLLSISLLEVRMEYKALLLAFVVLVFSFLPNSPLIRAYILLTQFRKKIKFN